MHIFTFKLMKSAGEWFQTTGVQRWLHGLAAYFCHIHVCVYIYIYIYIYIPECNADFMV